MNLSFLVCLLCVNLHAELFFTPQMIHSHVVDYSEQEMEGIQKDLAVVRSVCLDGTHNTDTRFFLATAGAPGARKTTILEKFVASHPEYQEGVYLDPDPRTLRFMVHTYYAQSLTPLVLSAAGNYDDVIKNAYTKWRAASNYIVLTLLEEAFAAGRSIIYGTTATGGIWSAFFKKLKENGYKIALLLCSCPDAVRREAVEYRNSTIRFYQSAPEDVVSKGLFFPQKMLDYFDYADILYFYWSDSLFSEERLAGVWQNGKLKIHDSEALQRFIDKYEADRKTLEAQNVSIPTFGSYLRDVL